MKFGQTLQQRSVPQWAPCESIHHPILTELMDLDNVDYEDLKHLIKEHTAGKVTSHPVAIPGPGVADTAYTELEDALFPILCQEHERVNLFTKSKYGEFERRIEHVDRQARSLNRNSNTQRPRPVQHSKRFERLAKEAESVGDDIQQLSRYVATQKQAFRKILKKYRKWTGSSGLELRMNNQAFNQPESVLNLDFMHLLDRLELAKSSLAALLHPERGVPQVTQMNGDSRKVTEQAKARSTASRLHEAFLDHSSLEFDAAFSTVPLGVAAGRATYWVHPDNLEEAVVLVRRYMRHRKEDHSHTHSKRPSLTSQNSQGHITPPSLSGKERVHVSMFDNLQRFLKSHGAITVGQTEAQVGSVASILAMSALWGPEPTALLLTSDLSPSLAPAQRPIEVSSLARRDLKTIFDPDVGSASRQSKSWDATQVHRDWLAQNRDIKPLAEMQCYRSRFAGLNNANEVGTWALLDTDVTLSQLDGKTIGMNGDVDGTVDFPHAVLELRWEFSRMPEVVRALDSTHLVERVRGFSLEAQAICAICKGPNVPVPMWQPLLERDIRKVPPLQAKASLRRVLTAPTIPTDSPSGPSSSEGPASILSSHPAQSSATSIDESALYTQLTGQPSDRPKPSTAKPPPKKKQSRRTPPPNIQRDRYWNEFDDGDEREDQVYTIYVNPDESAALPGAETVSKAFSAMYQSLGRAKRRVVSWLPLANRDHDEESARRPLRGYGTFEASEESSDSDTSIPPSRSRKRSHPRPSTPIPRHASQLPLRITSRSSGRRSRETTIFRVYLACYASSLIFLSISAILYAAGRHKARVEVDVGVILGVIAALAAVVSGGCLQLSREESLSWTHRLLGLGVLFLVVVGSGWLLTTIGTAA